jgi:hypothetical protein
LWANLRLGSAGRHHNIFFKCTRNKAGPRAFRRLVRQRPAGADQPEYGQIGCDGCATALCALRNCSLVVAGVALRAWCDCAAKACGADAAISAIVTALKTILRIFVSSVFQKTRDAMSASRGVPRM